MGREGANMALNFGGRGTGLFPQSERDNLGIGAKGSEDFVSLQGGACFPQTEAVSWIKTDGVYNNDSGGDQDIFAIIQIPNKATINSGLVTGTDSTDTWILWRTDGAGTSTQILGANVNTEDKTPVAGTENVDNGLYSYRVHINVANTKTIRIIKIRYTN